MLISKVVIGCEGCRLCRIYRRIAKHYNKYARTTIKVFHNSNLITFAQNLEKPSTSLFFYNPPEKSSNISVITMNIQCWSNW